MQKYKLGSIAKVEISSVDKKTKEGQKIVRLCNFVDVYHNWAITSKHYDSFMIASANDREIESFSIKKGQVALTKDSETRDDIGISTYIADDFKDVVLGYHTALVTPDENILSGKYLNAILHTKFAQKYFENNASGSGMRYTLSLQTLKDFPIYVPGIKEQERVANVFSAIDKKIALNREENATLEAMAKQLYDYWFVQFDFPDANGNPYKSSGGKMVWNEKLKREIPEGWEVSKLSSLLKFNKNGDWGTDDPTPTNGLEVNCVRGADIVKMDSLPIRYINSKNTEKLMQGGDLVVEISGGSPTQATGRVSYISEELLQIYNGKIICSNFCQYLRLKDVTLSEYFYYLWQLLYDNDNMFHYEGKTSGLKNLQIDTLLTESWYFPPSHIIEKFREVTLKTLRNRARTIKENKELTNLRVFLLPLLMNGQVTIKE